MRRLERPAITPPTLQPAGKGGRLADRHEKKYQGDRTTSFSFAKYWSEPDVRGALFAFHGRVCAYCQSALPHAAPGDVEHFRPSSRYWWLAYDFRNYFLGCTLCNQICKREHFPLRGSASPCTYEERHTLATEPHLLLHPELDPVESWLTVDWENAPCRVKLAPALSGDALPTERCEATLEFFRINLDVLLIKERRHTIDRALNLLAAARAGDNSRAHELHQMASRFRPHGLAVRQMLGDLGPSFLPNPEQELALHVDDLLADLRHAESLLASHPESSPVLRFRNEVLWSLAVIWRHPPRPVLPLAVEAQLTTAGCLNTVAALAAQL